MHESDESVATQRWILIGISLIVSIGAVVAGLRGLFSGKIVLFWGANDRIASLPFTGLGAVGMSGASLGFGISLLIIAIFLPRALEARSKRGSMFALPTWRNIVLIVAGLLFLVSVAAMMGGTFLVIQKG